MLFIAEAFATVSATVLLVMTGTPTATTMMTQTITHKYATLYETDLFSADDTTDEFLNIETHFLTSLSAYLLEDVV